jgi:hypothetical protein
MQRFLLDEARLVDWLDRVFTGVAHPTLDRHWDPTQVGAEDSVCQLVHAAQQEPARVIAAPPVLDGQPTTMEVHVVFDAVDSYTWLVDVDDTSPCLRLANGWQEIGRLVGADETGRPAAQAVLRQAVQVANACLDGLSRYLTGSRVTIEAVKAQAVSALSAATTRPDRPWLAGVVDALDFVTGAHTSDAMADLARRAPTHGLEQT